MKIAIVGSSGMIGSRFLSLCRSRFDLLEVDRTLGIDITDRENIFEFFKKNRPEIIIHFAAKTNVDGCELDKPIDLAELNKQKLIEKEKINFDAIDNLQWKGKTSAFAINVAGTKNLVDYCLAEGVLLIYISTDFVFDGEKEFYFEEDKPHAINWYGQTKLWGEDIIREKLISNYLISRIAYPYGARHPERQDFLARIKGLLSEGKTLSLVYDHIMTPTFIDDIINGLSVLIKEGFRGIYHLTGDSYITPYEIGELLIEFSGFNSNLIKKSRREEFFKGKARRPFKLRLDNGKIKKLGIKMKDFLTGLRSLKEN